MYKLYKENNFDFSLIREPPVIYISDIDETYLNTDFKSIRGLFITAIQFAVDKISYPDMRIFYKAIKEDPHAVLYFVSSSPVQLKNILKKKFLIDGIPHDGLILRDMVHLLLSGRVGELRNQFGYKLYAILTLFNDFPKGARIILIGDDSESDPDIYCTIQWIIEKKLDGMSLLGLLRSKKVPEHSSHIIVRQTYGIEGKEFIMLPIFIRVKDLQTLNRVSHGKTDRLLYFTHSREIIETLFRSHVLSHSAYTFFHDRCTLTGSCGLKEKISDPFGD